MGHGLREDIVVRNVGAEPTYVEIEVALDADFGRPPRRRGAGRVDVAEVEPTPVGPAELLLVRGRGVARVGCRVTASPGVTIVGGTLRWRGDHPRPRRPAPCP